MKTRNRGALMKGCILFISFVLIASAMHAQDKNTDFKIDGLTLAVTDMDKMLRFYSNVFGIEFSKQELGTAALYSGKWGGLGILFCPAEIAQNTARQNRHQFDIVTGDLETFAAKVREFGGELMGTITIAHDGSKSIGIYDPDKNSMVVKQSK